MYAQHGWNVDSFTACISGLRELHRWAPKGRMSEDPLLDPTPPVVAPCSSSRPAPVTFQPHESLASTSGLRTKPKVAFSCPFRVHVLIPDELTGEVPKCDCGRQHVESGKTYRYCTCGLSKSQVRNITDWSEIQRLMAVEVVCSRSVMMPTKETRSCFRLNSKLINDKR